MSEPKDPAIKLFGMTIPLPEISQSKASTDCSNGPTEDGRQDQEMQDSPSSAPCSSLDTKGDGEDESEAVKDTECKKQTEDKRVEECGPVTSEESSNPEAISGMSENPKALSPEEGTTSKSSKTEEERTDSSNSQEKPLKKPDKIIPCPRCNSMDTKFCYYNNYNVNQPRHFCKNCQRYWTAGGTMRNVPVGAGRRKNKNSSSHYRQITVPEALQHVQTDVPNGVHHPALKSNGTVLTFGSDMPLHESMASVLNLADKTMRNSPRNGFQKPDALKISAPYVGGENKGDHSNDSPVMASNSKDDLGRSGSLEPVGQNYQGFPPHVPCFPGAPWPYPWNSAQWGSPVSSPAFCPPGFPMPFYPAAAYWGCTAVPGPWNIPWLPQPSSPKQSTSSSGPNSPTLGKHSRDENMVEASNCGDEVPAKENNTERCLWIPKTLRIDDPGDAAKSSIWTTLGIKNENADSIGGRRLFKAFQSKGDDKIHTTETSSVLQANPAALSRSLKFQESS